MSGEATFTPPVHPSFPLDDARKPRVHRNDFGDGYGERFGDGINVDRAMLSLTWSNLTVAEHDAIWAVFESLQGKTAILYQPPLFSSVKKWVVPEFARSKDDADNIIITATFEQVFDL